MLTKQTCFVCPGCKFLGEESILKFTKVFTCKSCSLKLETPLDIKEKRLRKIFAVHYKKGYKCEGCKRFLPNPLCGSAISCPYYDCSFVGQVTNLKGMGHPTSKIDVSLESLLKKDSPASEEGNLGLLLETIEEELNRVHYVSYTATIVHKISVCQAFANVTKRMPQEMVSYLVLGKKNSSLQSKLFQEYIAVLESKLPFTYKRGTNVIKVDSLLDENLSIFDGISSFETTVNPKREIKNLTKEFYIGGRTGFHSKPFYMGKILDVISTDSGESLVPDIKEYSFLRILMGKTSPGTKVTVSHLRVPPHYQMGGMAHLNRIRKNIVDSINKKIADADIP